MRRPDDVSAVDGLLAAVAEHDGHAPIGEHKYLELLDAEADKVTGLVGEVDGRIVAYVALAETADPGVVAAELAVAPPQRGDLGLLLEAACERARTEGARRLRVWTFHPQLAAAVEEAGLVPERDLRQLRRSLPVEEAAAFPPGVETRGFRLGSDEEAWLEVNNEAFAGHPENGNWTKAMLDERFARPWFHPESVRMAWNGDTLLGFCWTKLHPGALGEIYILAVSARAQGRALGRALVLDGLTHLADEDGAREAMLYVDAANAAGLALYTRLGFTLHHVDRSFIRDV